MKPMSATIQEAACRLAAVSCLVHLQEANSNTETETESETESEPEGEGELKIEAEQKTGVEDALASPTAAAKFEEPPSETEVWPMRRPTSTHAVLTHVLMAIMLH